MKMIIYYWKGTSGEVVAEIEIGFVPNVGESVRVGLENGFHEVDVVRRVLNASDQENPVVELHTKPAKD